MHGASVEGRTKSLRHSVRYESRTRRSSASEADAFSLITFSGAPASVERLRVRTHLDHPRPTSAAGARTQISFALIIQT
jgi:hypothetical protein